MGFGLRGDLEAAFKGAADAEEPGADGEGPGSSAPPEPAANAAGDTEEQPDGAGDERARDEGGRFAKKEEKEKEKPAAKAAVKPTPKPVAKNGAATDVQKPIVPAAPTAAQVQAEPPTKAPSSWKPAMREKWSSLPPEVQAEILRREGDVTASLREALANKEFRDGFQKAYGPFEGIFRATGQQPMQVVEAMLQTAAALQTAPRSDKGLIIKRLMDRYGIGVDDVNAHLDPSSAPQGGQGFDPNAYKQQLFQEWEQRQQQQQQQAARDRANEQWSTFVQANDFATDVQETMGIVMQRALAKGERMTLEQAYEKACALTPEVAEVLAQRKAAEAAKTNGATTQRARAAASSVKSQPTAALEPPQGNRSLREDVEATIAALGNR
jgi:hypothetical protein